MNKRYESIVLLGMLLALLATLQRSSQAWGASTAPLAKGYIYATSDYLFYQYTPTMQLVNEWPLSSVGLNTPEGGAISSSGLYLTEGYSNGEELVAGLGPDGVIEESIQSLGNGEQRRCGIAVDPTSGDIYAAYTTQIFKVSANFSSITALPTIYTEEAGIAVSSNGTVYVADLDNNRIDVLNSTETAIASTIATGTGRSALAFGPNGMLYYTDGPLYQQDEGQIVEINLSAGKQTVIQSGLGNLSSLSFAPDGSYYVGDADGAFDYFSANGVLEQTVQLGQIPDGIAADVPEPASFALISVILSTAILRRRGMRTPKERA